MKAGVFTFGDNLPAGNESDIFVSYQVEGFPGGMLSGPYESAIIAEAELVDIGGYEGVKGCKLVTRGQLMSKDYYPYVDKELVQTLG